MNIRGHDRVRRMRVFSSVLVLAARFWVILFIFIIVTGIPAFLHHGNETGSDS